MLRNALFLALCAGNAFAFSPSSMPLGRRADATARLTLARETPRAARVSALRMQQQPATETEVYTEETTAEDVNAAPAPVSREPVSWFEKTTAQDREFREGGDPLAPLKVASPKRERTGGQGAYKGVTGNLEKESYGWYKNQETKKSVFGRTLNPLNGALEKKDDEAETMNLLEDPLFYVLLIVGAPSAIMVGAAYSCLVPALSLAFGAECYF